MLLVLNFKKSRKEHMILFSIYLFANLFFGGRYIFDGEILLGLQLILGPLIALGAGAGMKGAIIDGNAFQVKAGFVFLIVLLAITYFIYLQYDYGFRLPYIGYVNGYIWSAIGLVIGYLSANTSHTFPLLESINQDNYIHKRQIDHIFTLDIEGWEEHIKDMEPELNTDGWSSVKNTCETGSVLLINNPDGTACSFQPLFVGADSSNPNILIIGTYYPKGSIPFENENFRNDLKSKCEAELGESYMLKVDFFEFTSEMNLIEYTVSNNN